MTARLRLFLPILILAGLVNSALAGLNIKLARYGNLNNYRDVRKIVEAYVRSNTLSFPISAQTMGGNPNPGRNNFFYIEYEANGRSFQSSTDEGGIFTFQGIAGVRPPPKLPILRPPAPSAAPLRVINRTGSDISVYAIDRYGRWAWAKDLTHGSNFTAHGQVGQDWVITDSRRQVLEQYRIRVGANTVTLHPRFTPPGPGAPSRVRFENANRDVLYLYNVDRWGGWNWMALLEPYGVYEAATRPGEEWIATDRANGLVKQIRIAPGMSRVLLR